MQKTWHFRGSTWSCLFILFRVFSVFCGSKFFSSSMLDFCRV
jgi:hypothetical protein